VLLLLLLLSNCCCSSCCCSAVSLAPLGCSRGSHLGKRAALPQVALAPAAGVQVMPSAGSAPHAEWLKAQPVDVKGEGGGTLW
jgi:hypothetical protein